MLTQRGENYHVPKLLGSFFLRGLLVILFIIGVRKFFLGGSYKRLAAGLPSAAHGLHAEIVAI